MGFLLGGLPNKRRKDHESGNELGVLIAVTNHRGEFAFEDLPQDVLASSTFLRTVRPRGISQAMRQDLGNTVKLPDQTTATVGEVLAAYGYEQLQQLRKR